MKYSEDRISRELNKAEQQQQITHLQWLLMKNTRRGYARDKSRAQEISQWVSHQQEDRQSRRKPYFSLFKSKDVDSPKRQGRYLDVFNETVSPSFHKYENLSAMAKKQEEGAPSAVSPKKLNLQLPVPSLLQQYGSNPELLEAKKISLPLIKNLNVPVSLLKKGQRRRPKQQPEQLQPFLLRGNSESIQLGLKEEIQSRYKRGKMMGGTKRGISGLNPFNTKLLRSSLQNNKLQECITFIK